jgi:AbrB family looped-hinge helix DNA binding protein
MISSILKNRGQTTLPEPVRDALNLQPGDRVEYILKDGHVELRRASADLTALDGMLDRSDQPPVSVDEMDEAIERDID